MTKDDAYQGVQARLNDFTPATLTRIEASLAIGVGLFVAEHQWEFMDRYTTTVAVGTSGKDIITPPTDFFKPVVLFTDTNPEIKYIDRYEWAERQSTASSGTRSPQAYTLIGENMYLDHDSGGETIYAVYTKNGDNVNFEKIPGQYHPMVVLAMVMWLTPMVVDSGAGEKVPNPAYRAAESIYLRAVQRAYGLEMSNKGRPREKHPNQAQEVRSSYSR